MNERFFGDKRDLVKWSVLLHLAKKYRISTIVQICFRTTCDWPTISLDGKPPNIDIPKNIIEHFRSLRRVERMSRDVAIKVFCQLFRDRESYMIAARKFMDESAGQPRIVFLDPDTGLVPASGRVEKVHVTEKEARAFWEALKPRDILALYQHGNHAGGRWVDEKKEQFGKAIAGGSLNVHVARSTGIPRDVAFYYVHKV